VKINEVIQEAVNKNTGTPNGDPASTSWAGKVANYVKGGLKLPGGGSLAGVGRELAKDIGGTANYDAAKNAAWQNTGRAAAKASLAQQPTPLPPNPPTPLPVQSAAPHQLLQVTIPSGEYAGKVFTKNPKDHKWYDGNNLVITDPTDIRKLERLLTAQTQKHQMSPRAGITTPNAQPKPPAKKVRRKNRTR
jgi:hypothetical protein